MCEEVYPTSVAGLLGEVVENIVGASTTFVDDFLGFPRGTSVAIAKAALALVILAAILRVYKISRHLAGGNKRITNGANLKLNVMGMR